MMNFANDELSDDSVVITGIAGVFPSCDNINELRECLFKNENLVKSVTHDINWKRDKLDVPLEVGKINNPKKFDSMFFGISAAQASLMDPLARIMLERSYEAVVDSGHNPADLRKYKTNIYMGSNVSDSESVTTCVIFTETGFNVLGQNRSMIANRVSYWLNTNGSSYSFLATEPAGLMGISTAYRDIKAGYCDAALVGTVYLTQYPEVLYHFKEMGLLSKDSTCKSFDAEAAGYSRGESCVAIFMQKARHARRVYSSVVHSDYTCYGDQQRLISPHDNVFSDFLSNFYKTCGVDPSDISYLEADGSANKYYDPEELNAVDKVLLSNRKDPLLIGSVKGNLGHSDVASTFNSLAKVIIAMESGSIPATPFYKSPSPLIPALTEGKLKVVTETTKLNEGLVAINGLGIGCQYSHTLLKPYNKTKSIEPEVNNSPDLQRLVCVSGRNEKAVENVINKILSMPFDPEFLKLVDDVHSSNIANHNFRGYFIVSPKTNKTVEKKFQYFSGAKKPVWFVFSGMGSQWVGMGRDFMKLPVFASSIKKCHDILLTKGIDLIYILTGDDPHIFDNILNSFVGIAAIQIALVDMLKLLKIQPDGIVGHSVGELGCGYADECFTLEQMILAAYYRGLASIEAKLIHGSMAAIGCGYTDLKDKLPEGVDIACHNSADSCTISGPTEVILQYVKSLKAQGIFAKAVNVSNIAYHSRYIKSAAPKLLAYLKKIIPDPKLRSSRWISSSVPTKNLDTQAAKFCSAEYHTNNLLSAVLFEEACQHIPKNAIVIEIAPRGLLQSILRGSLGSDCLNVSLTQHNSPDGLMYFYTSIGKLYLAGLTPSISEIYPPVQYPVSRGTPSLSPFFVWDHDQTWNITSNKNLFENYLADYKVEIDLRYGEDQILGGHKINGHVIYPPSAYLKAVWVVLLAEERKDFLKNSILFQDIKFHDVLKLKENSPTVLHVSITPVSGRFEVFDDKMILATGYISTVEQEDAEEHFTQDLTVNVNNGYKLSGREIYKELEYKGHQYNSYFKKIIHASVGEEGAVAKIQWYGSEWLTFIDSVMQVAMWRIGQNLFTPQLPTYIQKVFIQPNVQNKTSSELTAVYQRATNIIQCGAVEISGIKMGKTNLENSYKINYETVRFFSHEKPNLQNKRDFLDISAQLLLETISSEASYKAITVVELINDFAEDSILHEMKYILSHKKGLKADLSSVSIGNIKALSEMKNVSLVLAKESFLEYGAAVVRNSSGFLLLRLPSDRSVPLNIGFVMVTEQKFDNEKYVLLKKCAPVDNQAVSFFHLNEDSSLWREQVKNEIKGDSLRNKIYVVCHEPSCEKVQRFVTEMMESGSKYTNIRYIFLLNDIPWTSHAQPQIYNQLSQDLPVNVYYNGEWGSFKQLSILPKNNSILKNLLTSISIPDFNLRFTSPNLNDWCSNENGKSAVKVNVDSLGAVDFSGVSSSGQRLMGLAKIINQRDVVEVEPLYTWTVPETWSLEDAATVPLAYALAYYTLTIRTSIKTPGKRILVHGGDTLIGEAFIAVALQLKCTVYTTVCNDNGILDVRKRFLQIPNKNIFKINKSVNFKLLNEFQGEGVDLIISSLSDFYLQSTLKCIRLHTKVFHFCQSDIMKNTEIGMEIFLQFIMFSSVLQQHLFDVSSQIKKELHDALENGIVSGVVQPLARRVYSLENGEEKQALQSLNFRKKVLIKMDNEKKNVIRQIGKITDAYHFNSHRSCLVVGNKAEDCLDVAKWLVTRGMYSIIMYSEASHTTSYVERQLKILHSSYTPQVRFSSVDKNESPQVLVTNLLKDCIDTASLDSIFLISLVDKSLLHHLDKETRNLSSLNNFVCLSMDVACNVAHSRRKAGLSVLDVNWSGHHSLHQVLPGLESLLPDPPSSSVSISLREEKDEDITTMSDSEKSEFLLKSSQKMLVEVGQDVLLQKSVPYEELVTRGPGLNYVKEILPIYMIPGLQGASKKMCESLARNLINPVILLRIPPYKTIYEMASTLKNQIHAIQREGPYNILGLTWAGALALQVAQELENDGHKTQTFLIDGTPEVIQKIFKKLGEGVQLQINLLKKLLDIQTDQMSQDLISDENWDDFIKRCLKDMKTSTEKEKEYILEGVNAIYKRIHAVINYKPKDLSLEHEVYVLQSQGIEDEYNKNFDEVLSYKMKFQSLQCDHYAMLSDRNVANMICDNTLVNLHMKTLLRS